MSDTRKQINFNFYQLKFEEKIRSKNLLSYEIVGLENFIHFQKFLNLSKLCLKMHPFISSVWKPFF